jgi:hypothetical protein
LGERAEREEQEQRENTTADFHTGSSFSSWLCVSARIGRKHYHAVGRRSEFEKPGTP